MKYYICLLILPFTLASCNDWLNVSPEDEIGEDELFSSGEGYRNALNGVYKSLSEFGLYGRHLSWGFLDGMGQYYGFVNVPDLANDIDYASRCKYDDVSLKPNIETVWEKAYNAVANCNNIIQNIGNEDPEKFLYKEWERKMIWGEALALRAFIQFDMLRLFAAAPVAKSTKAYIPYINVYPSFVSQKLTVDECLKFIVADLKAAKPLVAARDSVMDFNVMNRFETVGLGAKRFIQTRGYRLNYYAISALLARAYLYAGMPEAAYDEAVALIRYQDAKKYFSFKSISSGGRKLYNDVLAALNASKLTEWEAQVYDFTAPKSWDWSYLSLLNVENIYQGDLYYDDYEKKTTSYDYRFRDLIDKPTSDYVSLKYRRSYGTGAIDEVSNTMIPLIRMSEVYYIAAEAIMETDLEQAKDYLFAVKSGRGIRSSRINQLRTEINSVSKLRTELLNDARREFVGEGQIFYMHKRMGVSIPAASGAVIPTTEKNMVLPLPEGETSIK